MSMIEIDGFLSPATEGYLGQCRRKYGAWFDVIKTVNRIGQSLRGEVRIDPINLQQSMAGLMYVRVLGHAQGAVLLIERCMLTQGEVLCRASLEALFGSLAVVEQPDTAQLLARGDRHHQSRLLKATLQGGESLGDDDQQRVLATLQEIKEDLKREPSPEIMTECLAQRAGLVELYNSAYKLLSLSVDSISATSNGSSTSTQKEPQRFDRVGPQP